MILAIDMLSYGHRWHSECIVIPLQCSLVVISQHRLLGYGEYYNDEYKKKSDFAVPEATCYFTLTGKL